MNIIQLIEKVGMRDIQIQTVAHSFVKGRTTKHGAQMTIETTQEMFNSTAKEVTATGEGTHIGLILWIPRDRLREDSK